MTQVLTTSYFGSWSEVHFDRNKSNWLESYPKSLHYSRKKSDSKTHLTPISEISKKPLEEVTQILCENSSIDIQSPLKCGQSEHNLRTKRIIKRYSTPETNQKITSYFVDRKFSRPSIRSEKSVTSLTSLYDSSKQCISESALPNPELPGRNIQAAEPVNDNVIKITRGTSQISTESRTSEGVIVPSWRTRVYTGKYIIEGTEDLSEKVFEERHLKHEIAEKKRKKRDEKCLEEQERLGKFNRVNTFHSPKKKVLHIEVLEADPKCAFGYVIPDTPQEDFDLPPEFFTLRRVRQRKMSKSDSFEFECSTPSTKLKKLKKAFSIESSQ